MKNNVKDKIIISKIINYCEDIEAAHQHFNDNKELFFDKQAGRVYRNAVTMPILQIGELAKNLTEDFIKTHNLVPWKAIIRTRDFFAHHYWEIEYSDVWDTSHEDIEELKKYLLHLI